MMTDLMRWSLFDDLRALERQLGQWSRPSRGAGIMPSVEVVPDENGWRLRVALPGVSPENLEVNVTGQKLHIRANEREGDTVTMRFEETVALPDTVDVEKITAMCRHGRKSVGGERLTRLRDRRGMRRPRPGPSWWLRSSSAAMRS